MEANNKNNLLKNTGLIILIITAIPVILNAIVFSWEFKTSLPFLRIFNTNSDLNAWVSFWGNLVGAAISGIVAVYVAIFTINKQSERTKRLEVDKLIINQLPALIKIRIEVEKAINEILRLKQDKKEIIEEVKEQQCYQDTTNHDYNLYSVFYLEPLNEDSFKEINTILDVNLQVDLIEFQVFYNNFREALAFDLNYEKTIYEESITDFFEGKKAHSMEDSNRRKQIEFSKKHRIDGWKSLEEENYFDTLTAIFVELYNRIDLIDSKLKDKSFYS